MNKIFKLIIKGFALLGIVGLLFTSVTTVADPITSANLFTFRDNEGASPVGTGQGDNFTIGVFGVSPSAAEGTTGRAFNLDTLDELILDTGIGQGRPDLIGLDIPFDQALANGWLTPWEITLTNGVDTRIEFTFDRTGVPKMEFVKNLAISGPATVPIVTWQLPTTGPAVTAIGYEVWDVDSGVILTPGQLNLPAVTETLTLDNVTLEIGGNYAVRIVLINRDGGNRTLTRSSNWIGWTATSGQAVGEVLELVTGSPVGVSQVVDAPASTFVVEFDYSFATATVDLEVFIDGNKIGTTLTAPTTVSNEFYHAVFEVEDTSLLGLTLATFLIQLDGPTGSTVLVDNIVLAGLANGDFSSGVAEWTPTGSGSVATVLVNDAPTAFALVSPADGATGLDTSLTFVWKKATDPDGDSLSYQFSLCENDLFVDPDCAPMVASAEKLIDYAGAEGLLPLVLFGTVLGGIGLRRRKWLMMAIVSLAIIGLVSNCGGGSSTPAPTDEISHTESGLKTATTYFWKVSVSDGTDTVESTTRSFTTQ